MISNIEEAKRVEGQHKKPCHDCPWRKVSVPGWLGGIDREDWLYQAHGEARIDCHTLVPAQCAGAAIYRTNVCKEPRDRSLLLLPESKRVFDCPQDFMAHHDPATAAKRFAAQVSAKKARRK